MRWTFATAGLLLAFSHMSLVSAKASCSHDTFANMLPEGTNTTLRAVTAVGANGTYGETAATDPDFPANATGLPPLCAISYYVDNADGTFFTFGMYLPDTWNNRMMGAGNTGFGGGLDWTEMGPMVKYGFATISTDTGHLSNPGSAGWANNAPNAQKNWGYYALHMSVVLGKQVINGYYGSNASYSYYSACSGGGRQGLRDLQLYPNDFNGVIAGAAPWLLSHLHPWAVKVGIPNLLADPKNNLSDSHFETFNAEVIRQCDPQDGHVDQVVSDPYNCKFDYTPLQCNSTFANTTQCFSSNQVNIMKAIYSDWIENNNLLYPSFDLSSDASGLGNPANGTPSAFGTEYVDNFVMNNTNWDWKTINASTVTIADSLDPGNANADLFDLSAFQKAGGKLLTYHGMADPLIPTATSIYYYEQVLAAMSGVSPANDKSASTSPLDDFYRMFLVPGMYHCSGSSGYAPWYFAGASQQPPANGSDHSVNGFMDAQHDVVLATMAWVENGTAPDSLVVTSWHNNDAAQGVKSQRPLCPYPQQAKFQGGRDSQADSWKCVNSTFVGLNKIDITKQGSADPPPQSSSSKAGAEGLASGSAGLWVAAIMGALMLV